MTSGLARVSVQLLVDVCCRLKWFGVYALRVGPCNVQTAMLECSNRFINNRQGWTPRYKLVGTGCCTIGMPALVVEWQCPIVQLCVHYYLVTSVRHRCCDRLKVEPHSWLLAACILDEDAGPRCFMLRELLYDTSHMGFLRFSYRKYSSSLMGKPRTCVASYFWISVVHLDKDFSR